MEFIKYAKSQKDRTPPRGIQTLALDQFEKQLKTAYIYVDGNQTVNYEITPFLMEIKMLLRNRTQDTNQNPKIQC